MAKPAKDSGIMSASEVNKELDAIDGKRSKLIERFIIEGRGHETSEDIAKLSDPLATEWNRLTDRYLDLKREVYRRASPGVSKLPRGYGPIRGY